ncbi:hypothetical protein C5Y96_11355 [Blastopirellula marina]|uniref:Uncharacterized protein n=2 Tax=Pirellulales TaxID=2691354 RepID=A0A2S8FMK4_9BACT|nr:hypothetical protein C5Y96_11355 [Blastopirellula marina]RCS52523.1 hypothetical protein DTL36_11365 [Bremerella cremea]
MALLSGGYAWGDDSTTQTRTPYADIDWDSVEAIGGVTHAHCRSQRSLDMLCRRGLRHLAISNYYPSAPCKPDERIGQYNVGQDFCTIPGEGYVYRQFRWNEIIQDPKLGWYDKLPVSLQETIPFEVGGPCFTQIPSDVVICPNAEHHSMTDSNGHFNAVGSEFCSGTFDARSKYMLNKYGYKMGTGMPWKEAFTRMFADLQFADGGGVTINHPTWSGTSHEQLLALLDFDPRVLGIEIWNNTAEMLNGKGWSLSEWDTILASGRRCYGFAVSDHAHNSDPDFRGQNVLLVDAKTPAKDLPAACLRAYRNGNFYASLKGRIKLTRLEITNGQLRVEVSTPCKIRVVSAKGRLHEQSGQVCHWSLPEGSAVLGKHTYLRVEAAEIDGDDQIFSQALPLA